MSSDSDSEFKTRKVTAPVGLTTPTGTKGRKGSNIWELFTDEENAHKLKSALCKNCHQRVNYHKKSEYAKSHLLKCINFKKIMYGNALKERPEWFPSKRFMFGTTQQESMFN